jgi:ATP synthase protein I
VRRNTDWQAALQREESLRRKVEEAKARPPPPSGGFLSLSRVSELERMDVDLSEVLARKRQEKEEQEAQAAAAASLKAGAGKRPGTAPGGLTGLGRPGVPRARLGRRECC